MENLITVRMEPKIAVKEDSPLPKNINVKVKKRSLKLDALTSEERRQEFKSPSFQNYQLVRRLEARDRHPNKYHMVKKLIGDIIKNEHKQGSRRLLPTEVPHGLN